MDYKEYLSGMAFVRFSLFTFHCSLFSYKEYLIGLALAVTMASCAAPLSQRLVKEAWFCPAMPQNPAYWDFEEKDLAVEDADGTKNNGAWEERGKKRIWTEKYGLLSAKFYKDSLRLTGIGNNQRYVLYPADFLPALAENIRESGFLKQEKTIPQIALALQGESVEARLRNIAGLFKEGDYLNAPAIFFLIGIDPAADLSADPLAVRHLAIARQIEVVFKRGDMFVAVLKGGKEINEVFPLLDVSGNGLINLSLEINPFCFAKISLPPQGASIKVSGVKAGTGWLKLPLPRLSVEGDKGKVLGFEFWLNRR